MYYFLSSLSLQTYWLCMANFIFPFIKLTMFVYERAARECVFFFILLQLVQIVRWFCQTFNIILKARRLKVIFSVWWKGPLYLALIRFVQSSIKSVWHSSAPLCIVRLCSKAVILEDNSLILVWYRPCALCRQVNYQMKKQLTLIIQIAWVKTK